MAEQLGKVKWFNNNKGYGFIENSGGEDVFVHYRQISADGFRTLREKQAVKYTAARGPKGLHAENVELLDCGS